jgi:hypothetical protein
VRGEHQPGALGDRERRREVGGAAPSLVVGQSEADHAPSGVLGGEPGQRPCVEWVPGPVGRDDHRHAQTGRRRRVPDCVEHQVGEGGDAVEARGVPAGVDLDLQPPATVGHVVLGGLAHEPADVVLGAQHRPGDVVEPLEAEPALLVRRGEPWGPVLDQGVRKDDPVTLGELEQRLVTHRAGEVQVQVCLGQRGQRPPLPV